MSLAAAAPHRLPIAGPLPSATLTWDPDRLIALAYLALVGLVLIAIANLLDLIWRTRGPEDGESYGEYLEKYLQEMRVDRYEDGSPEKVDKATLASIRAQYAWREAREQRRTRLKRFLDTLCERLERWLPERWVAQVRRALEWWFRL